MVRGEVVWWQRWGSAFWMRVVLSGQDGVGWPEKMPWVRAGGLEAEVAVETEEEE